jgi:hypothetical protein
MFEFAGTSAAMPGGSAIDLFPMSLLIASADSIRLVKETAAYRSVFTVLARDLAQSNGCQAHHPRHIIQAHHHRRRSGSGTSALQMSSLAALDPSDPQA